MHFRHEQGNQTSLGRFSGNEDTYIFIFQQIMKKQVCLLYKDN